MKRYITFALFLTACSPSFESNPAQVSALPMSERRALCEEIVAYSDSVECDGQQPSMFDLDACLEELTYLEPCVASQDILACARQACESTQPACVRVYEATCTQDPTPENKDPRPPSNNTPQDPDAPKTCTCDTVDPFPNDPARLTYRFCQDFSCGSARRCLWNNKSEAGTCETPCRESEFPNQGSCREGQLCDALPAVNISDPNAGDLHYVCQ